MDEIKSILKYVTIVTIIALFVCIFCCVMFQVEITEFWIFIYIFGGSVVDIFGWRSPGSIFQFPTPGQALTGNMIVLVLGYLVKKLLNLQITQKY